MTRKTDVARCCATTARGNPCSRRPLLDSGFCRSHDQRPGVVEARRAASARGGRNGRKYHGCDLPPLDPSSAERVQEFQEAAVRAAVEGQIDSATAKLAIDHAEKRRQQWLKGQPVEMPQTLRMFDDIWAEKVERAGAVEPVVEHDQRPKPDGDPEPLPQGDPEPVPEGDPEPELPDGDPEPEEPGGDPDPEPTGHRDAYPPVAVSCTPSTPRSPTPSTTDTPQPSAAEVQEPGDQRLDGDQDPDQGIRADDPGSMNGEAEVPDDQEAGNSVENDEAEAQQDTEPGDMEPRRRPRRVIWETQGVQSAGTRGNVRQDIQRVAAKVFGRA